MLDELELAFGNGPDRIFVGNASDAVAGKFGCTCADAIGKTFMKEAVPFFIRAQGSAARI